MTVPARYSRARPSENRSRKALRKSVRAADSASMDGMQAAVPDHDEVRSDYSIDELQEIVVHREASDLHVTSGTEPVIRVDGKLERLEGFAPLVPEQAPRPPS